jgi:hypothetical protein
MQRGMIPRFQPLGVRGGKARPVKLYNHAVARNPRRVRIFAAALSVTCNGSRPLVARKA